MAGLRLLAALLSAGVLLPGCVDTSGSRAAPSPKPPPQTVDVQLSADAALPTVACEGSWTAVDGKGQPLGDGAELPATVPTIRAGRVTLGGREFGSPPVLLQPRTLGVLLVNGKPYRGQVVLDFNRLRGGGRVLNRLPVEDYLLGVVPGEMLERFGLEALKAQAIAARSYALSEVAERGFLFADTRSQVYGGRGIENALATRAVRETAGKVLVRGKRIVRAWYHSTCGGRTAPAASVFPDAPAGVMETAVACPDCRLSPHYAWTRRFPGDLVRSVAELPPGKLEQVTVEPATLPDRPTDVTIRAGGHDVTLSMLSFRERISAGRPLAEQMPSTLLTAPPQIDDDTLVLEGRGWGHGVGLCQYGASGFAARGANCEAILARYYPGADIGPIP